MKLSRIVCIGLLCSASISFAQERSDITHDVIAYEQSAYGQTKGFVATKSSTGSKMDIDIKEIPQSIVVITKDMMENRNAQTVQNITAYTASVNQPYGEFGDTRTNYGKLRGISHLYKSTFLDGTKLLHAGHMIPNYDAYALQRAEVLKGPSSVLYGASGPGGLLNLQSKRPSLEQEKEFGISYGSKKNKTVFTDINHSINENIAIRLTGKFKKGDNQLDKSTNESYFFNPALTYFIDDNTTFDLNASFAKTKTEGLGLTFSGSKTNLDYHNSIASNAAGIKLFLNNLPDSIHPQASQIKLLMNAIPDSIYIQRLQDSAKAINDLNLPSNTFIGLANKEVFEKEHQAIGGSLAKTLSDKTKFRTSFRAMQQEGIMNYSQPSTSGLVQMFVENNGNPDLSKIPMEYFEIDAELKSFVLDNHIQFDSNFNKNIENKSLLGIDFQFSDYDRKTTKASQYRFDLANPNAPINVNANSTYLNNFNTKTSQIGLYATNTMKINEKFIVNTSLRYDKLKEKKKGMETQKGKAVDVNSTQKDNNISGRLGLTYLLNDQVAPYATYSTSFVQNIGSSEVDGSKFKPSKGKQIELGVKYVPSQVDAIVTLAAFKIEEEDTINRNSQNKSIQKGDAQVKGIELDISAQPIENMNLTFSISKLDGEQKNMANPKENGLSIDNLPEITAAVWSDYTIKNTQLGDLTFGAGIKYTGDAKNISADYFDFPNGNPKKEYNVKSYTITDAMIASKYKDLRLALNINNIFDKKAQLDNMPIRTAETAGRTFTFTAKYNF